MCDLRSTIKKPILFTRMEKDANMTSPGQTNLLHGSKTFIARCIRYSYTKYAVKFSQCRNVAMTGFVILSSEISLPFCNLNYAEVKLNKKSQKSFQGWFMHASYKINKMAVPPPKITRARIPPATRYIWF